jgi:hypothetical protein
MFPLLRWIRKRQGYGLLKDPKTREDDRWTQEKQEQQQFQMLLTLHELQRTMDPLVAAQVYNNRFCPLARLPEELLLLILKSIDDGPTLHCLRTVSRTFFHLTHQPQIWRHEGHSYQPLRTGTSILASSDMAGRLGLLLERDGQCDDCRRWGKAHPRIHGFRFRCKFRPFELEEHCRINNSLYCHACGSPHNPHQFSSFYKQGKRQERQCLGYQGSVKLCEHMHINWASIRDHISDWQQRKPGDWQACLESFSIVCHDSSHDMRCTAEEAPTWPRGRLQIAASDPDLVVLNLEWAPHSGFDAVTATTDSRLPVSDLRAIFWKFRQGPASILFPAHRQDYFPELACFNKSLDEFDCVQYETGDNKRPPSPTTKIPILQSHLKSAFVFTCYNSRRYGYGENGQRIDIKIHCPRGTSNSSNSICLIVIYQCDILVCKTTDCTKINPTHEWLHAMDPDTYPHSQASHVRPLCRDGTCMNYYRMRKLISPCHPWPYSTDGLVPNKVILGQIGRAV